MTTLELLLLLLLVSLVVIGTSVAVTLKRIFGAICLVTDPIATVLERLKGQEWQERHLLRHAADEEPRDPDEEWDAGQTLEAAIGRYRHALLHCHECEEEAQEAITKHEARKRFDEGWRDHSLPCPRAGCDGRYEVSVHKVTGAIGRVTRIGLCEHADEMARNLVGFFGLSGNRPPPSHTGTSSQ